MPTVNVYAASMLAGSFRGKDFGDRYVQHAVSDSDVSVGRLKRASGEAFCNKKYNDADGNLSDQGGWDSDVSKVDCPKCKAILETHFKRK